MKSRNRCLAMGIFVLLVSFGCSRSAFADWDDGTWPLNFGETSRSASSDSDREFSALCSFLSEAETLDVAEILLLDDDTVVVKIATDRDSETFLIAARDLQLLLEILEDAGLELVTSTRDEAISLGLALILM